MFEIVRYTSEKAGEWNRFVATSKNGTFLFYRDYMDYHADRFEDYSLMFYQKGKLYALLPANREDSVLCSHRGLTYGGLIMDAQCRTAMVRDLFFDFNNYLKNQGFTHVEYKHVPWIYCNLPAEEDLFAIISCCHSSKICRDIASVVMLDKQLPFSNLRRRGVKKGIAAKLQVSEVNEFTEYWELLEENLLHSYNAKPVHSLREIELLHSRFPGNIRLFIVRSNERIVGGTVLYLDKQTVKTQYISANEEGKKIGALDYLFSLLIQKFAEKGLKYFDFGTSNQLHTNDLNESLIFQKEGFGGRGVCYDIYEWNL